MSRALGWALRYAGLASRQSGDSDGCRITRLCCNFVVILTGDGPRLEN